MGKKYNFQITYRTMGFTHTHSFFQQITPQICPMGFRFSAGALSKKR